ncbi:MAG: universal stress protein [Mucilaginibacter sp.]
MKTILVPTDFSDNATHAARSAVMLGGKLNANLLLFNNFIGSPVIPQFNGGPWVAEEMESEENESIHSLQNIADKLEPAISRYKSAEQKPAVHMRWGEGSLADNIVKLIEEKDIELIVIGARSGSKLSHMLNGSDVTSIINKSTRPVFVIPSMVELRPLEKVIFATDFNDADTKALYYMIKLGKLLNFKLKVVNVSLPVKKAIAKSINEAAFLKHIKRSNYPSLSYKEIKGKDVIDSLNEYCKKENADVLALVHYRRSFFMRLIQQSTSSKALSNQRIPLLILPSEM